KEYSGSARTGDGSVRRDQVGLAGQNTQYFIGVQLDGSQQLEPLHNCIADDTAKEGQLLVKQTAENVDDAVRELPDANMIILGSSSKARRQILAEMGYEFTIMTADIDEKSNWKEKPEDLVMALAEAKVCDQNKVNGSGVEIVSDEVKSKSFRKAKYDDEMPPNIDLDEWDHTASRTGSSSNHASSTQSLNPSSRFLSRFSFIPGNISFRLGRTTSLWFIKALSCFFWKSHHI
ncbi:hypothetical protein S83_031991, partial [Arachis hypogaea]